jgi:outer membrane receptor protein involved in Fe transport
MTRSMRTCAAAAVAMLLLAAGSAAAQEFRGRINGVVTDNTGAVLPGVAVTATSPALIQPQVQVTGNDGSYRLIALPAGTYTLTFELTGFSTVKREGIRVAINQTLPVDAQLPVATLQETVTVTGESPVVDTSTTTVGTNFTKELLTEIPNARDIWAAMAQAPGLQVTGFDVGGSHTGTQTGYVTYGVSQQNTTRIEGINTTEGASANAGYFDFGSFEEFQIGGAGNMADQDVPGASLNITVKSGGDRFSGMFYGDWEGDSTISDNVPDVFKTAGQRDDDGFFRRSPLERGNAIDRQYDINANVGGPLWKGKAWFFYSYRLNDQYKNILGFDELAQSKLTNPYTFKGTFQLSENNQLIGYLNKREKLQALRDFGPQVPLSAAYYQASRNYPMKLEWTSVLSSRMFLDVLVGQWYNFFPLRPQTEVGVFPVEQFVPGRLDTTTGSYFAGGANDYYQDQKRFKPQFHTSLSYFQDGWHGSHDMKFGFEARRDRRKLFNDQPFNLFYQDRSGAPEFVDIYNGPVEGINDVDVRSAYVQDSWKWSDRLTLNLGLRMDHYTDGWPEQSLNPSGVPVLAGDPRFTDFFAPRTVAAKRVSESTTFGPRAGFVYDLTGKGKTVLKAFYGRFYFNSADIIADLENPVGAAQLRYRFNDLNGNRILDGPEELGAFDRTLGGAGFVRVDTDLKRPYGQEISTHLEQELREGLSGRVSYVHKNLRDDWMEVDVPRAAAYTIPITVVDPGVDGLRGTSDDQQLSLVDRSSTTPSDRVFTNPDYLDSDYHTVEVALNRRFAGGWMLLTSFEHTWLKEYLSTVSSTSALSSAGLSKAAANGTNVVWQPNRRRFGAQNTTLWNYKLIGRYSMPWGLGVSGSYKLQSGRNWSRELSVALPNARTTELISVEPADSNRAPNVGIVDVRFDKAFSMPRRFGKVVAMIDVFNLANSGTVTAFRTRTATNFQEVTALLDPRIVRFGIRYEF